MHLLRDFRFSALAAGVAASLIGLGAIQAPALAQESSQSDQQAQSGPDSDLVMRVKSALKSDSTLDARHVDVAMYKGKVVLKGFVESERALQDATQVATKAAGDRKVVNRLTIKQNQQYAP